MKRKLDQTSPEKGLARYGYLLWNNIWKLLALNVLTLAAALPVVTFPAAICGSCRVLTILIRTGNVLLWEEFRDEFLGSFKKSLLHGLLFAVLYFIAYYLLSMGTSYLGTLFGMIFLAVGLVLTGFVALWSTYTAVLTGIQDLPARKLLHNALLLFLSPGGHAGAVLGMVVFCVLFTIAIFPVSLILLPLVGLVLPMFTACWFVYDAARKYIIREDAA